MKIIAFVSHGCAVPDMLRDYFPKDDAAGNIEDPRRRDPDVIRTVESFLENVGPANPFDLAAWHEVTKRCPEKLFRAYVTADDGSHDRDIRTTLFEGWSSDRQETATVALYEFDPEQNEVLFIYEDGYERIERRLPHVPVKTVPGMFRESGPVKPGGAAFDAKACETQVRMLCQQRMKEPGSECGYDGACEDCPVSAVLGMLRT